MLTDQQKQKIDDIFQLWMDHQGAGGQLVVVHKGETVYEQCYCYANAETKEPITQESVFSVASVSKQITAMSIMILQERGLLNIEDDIRKYLPDVVKFPEPVTISHMLHHTSGLRECYELVALYDRQPGEVTTVPLIVKLLSRQKSLNFTPGTQFSYSNSGYILLAVIVERLTGMTLNEFAQENIFKPLGMTHSRFRDRPDLVIPNCVKGHHDDGTRYTLVTNEPCTYGSGGLRSTARDLVKFMPQYVNPTLVSKELMEKVYLQIPPLADGTVTNYACGVRINELLGHKYYHHGGVNGGFRAFSVIFPDDDLVIAVNTNTYNIPIETAGRDVARVILGLPERKIGDLEAFRGEGMPVSGYYLSAKTGRRVQIKVDNGQVFVQFMGKWAPLTHLGDNLYKMGRRNITFAFDQVLTVDQEGAVDTLTRLTEGVKDPDSYTGTYYSDETMGTITVSNENGKLVLTAPSGNRCELHLTQPDTFCYGSLGSYGCQYVFNRAEDGTVTGVTYVASQITGLVFKKS